MKTKEIKASIRAKEKEIRKLQKDIAESDDVEEVKTLGEQIDAIIEELDKLKEQLDNSEPDPDDPDNSERFNPSMIYGFNSEFRGGMRVAGSFSFNGNKKRNGSENSVFLTRGQSWANRIKDARKDLDLGKYIRGISTGDWRGAEEERDAMSTSVLGAVIPSFLSAQIIDRARNISLFTSSGVPVVPMEGNSLTIGRVETDPVFAFKEEGKEGKESNFTLNGIELNAKTAYGYAYVSLEAIHSAKNLTDILNRAFSAAIANAIDVGVLYGQKNSGESFDAFAPSGIMNDSAVGVITATNKGYDDFIRAVGKVQRENGVPSVMAVNAVTEENLDLLVDSNGNYQEPPKSIETLERIVTNQLAYDESTGSDALVFDPMAMIIGMQNNIVVRMITDSDYCIKNGVVGFQIYAMIDGAAVQPKHICKITGLKAAA